MDFRVALLPKLPVPSATFLLQAPYHHDRQRDDEATRLKEMMMGRPLSEPPNSRYPALGAAPRQL
jgi:hypothetical protein